MYSTVLIRMCSNTLYNISSQYREWHCPPPTCVGHDINYVGSTKWHLDWGEPIQLHQEIPYKWVFSILLYFANIKEINLMKRNFLAHDQIKHSRLHFSWKGWN